MDVELDCCGNCRFFSPSSGEEMGECVAITKGTEWARVAFKGVLIVDESFLCSLYKVAK